MNIQILLIPDIIQQIMKKAPGDIPYRPKLSVLGSSPKFVTDCIKDCWNEEPSVRPDFKTIRRMLKPMQKGMLVEQTIDILDHTVESETSLDSHVLLS